jgi:hypothetical protein
LYKDGVLVGSWDQGALTLPNNYVNRFICGTDPPIGVEGYTDYWYIDNGLKPPGQPQPTYSDVTISITGQGTTSPAAGHYPNTYLVGGSLTITPIPASGWAFDYMTRNGVTASSMMLTSLGASEYIVVYFKTGSATTGTLRVFASYNGAYVVASITAVGPQTVSGSTTTNPANPLAFTVSAGTYIVSGTYTSGSATPVTVTVPVGGSVDANLNFGGEPPWDPFKIVRELFQNPTVKSLMLISGLAMTGLGAIALFMSRRRRPAYAPAPYY